jgi:thioesterase domain-containing protein
MKSGLHCAIESLRSHSVPSQIDPKNRMTGTSNAFTDEAHAALWRKMLAVAKHLREQQPLPLSQPSPIVQMRQGSGGVPVYWIEPDLDEFKIAQLTTANNPIYAVEIRLPSVWYELAARNETKGLPTVEQIVAPYVAAIKAQPYFSRCILCGHSFGGIIAFEAARQLALLNIQVETILLLDTGAVYPSSHQAAWQKLKQIWFPAANTPIAMSIADRLANSLWTIRWLLGFKWRGLANLIISKLTRRPERLTTRLDDTGRPLAWPRIQYVYDTAMSSYLMSQRDCRGVLFRAESKQDDDTGSRSLEIHLGWDGLFRKGLEIVPVPGGHVSMLRQPHADVLAREISVILSGIPAEQEERAAACAASEQCLEPRIA